MLVALALGMKMPACPSVSPSTTLQTEISQPLPDGLPYSSIKIRWTRGESQWRQWSPDFSTSSTGRSKIPFVLWNISTSTGQIDTKFSRDIQRFSASESQWLVRSSDFSSSPILAPTFAFLSEMSWHLLSALQYNFVQTSYPLGWIAITLVVTLLFI